MAHRTEREALQQGKEKLALALNQTAALIPRFKKEIEASNDNGAAVAEREHHSLVDYLIPWLGEGSSIHRALYLGERSKMAYNPKHDGIERSSAISELIHSDQNVLEGFLKDAQIGAAPEFLAPLDQLAGKFTQASLKEMKVLFVGDCLFLDVVSFLTEQVLDFGVVMTPYFVTSKSSAQALDEIRAISGENFDLVFYSPFTFEYNLNANVLLQADVMTKSTSDLFQIVDESLSDVRRVLNELANSFSAQIFVHNAALLQRHTHTMKQAMVRKLTRKKRHEIRKVIDRRIDELVEATNQATFHHVHKFDELALAQKEEEADIGAYLHHFGLQHPAKFSALIAEAYADILEVIAHLFKKKLIACDLDNTLWDGIIGDGPVENFIDRQTILKGLRQKGVLLTIVSKNDPANVHFSDAVLQEDDFVYKHINWEPKVTAFPKTEAALNLKRKDFLFIDDRADERGMVSENFPEIRVLDATDARVWRLFGIWESILSANPEMDRTKMYHERAEREAFTTQNEAAIDNTEMFKGLDLVLTVSETSPKGLERATELLNRTNQFNMTGRRTNFVEMKSWSENPKMKVISASMRDKFGDMGVIGVLVLNMEEEQAQIDNFVLSCRVFGYDAEQAILNTVKEIATENGLEKIKGDLIPTQVNGPCMKVYEKFGFNEVEEGTWVWSSDMQSPENAEWLSVEKVNL